MLRSEIGSRFRCRFSKTAHSWPECCSAHQAFCKAYPDCASTCTGRRAVVYLGFAVWPRLYVLHIMNGLTFRSCQYCGFWVSPMKIVSIASIVVCLITNTMMYTIIIIIIRHSSYHVIIVASRTFIIIIVIIITKARNLFLSFGR